LNPGQTTFLRSAKKGDLSRGVSPVLAFKSALFALLAANTAYFAIMGALSKAVDAGAWLVLLALFEGETRFGMRLRSAGQKQLLRAARLAAGAGVVAAAVGYIVENNALDAVNSALWIAVVVLLEVEVRYRETVQRLRLAFYSLAACLYGALALIVVLWAVRRQWFDAYDAFLWLVAFATVEVDLMGGKKA
jgi:hypothetical protein